MSKNKYKNNAPMNKNFKKSDNEEKRPAAEKPVQNLTARGDPQEMKAGPQPQNEPIPDVLDHQVAAPSMDPGSVQRADLLDTAQAKVRPNAGFTETNSIPAGGLGEFKEQLTAQGVPEEAITRESTPDPGALEPGADRIDPTLASNDRAGRDNGGRTEIRPEGRSDSGKHGPLDLRMDRQPDTGAGLGSKPADDANTYQKSQTTAGRREGQTDAPSAEHSEYTAVPLENKGRRTGFPWWWILLPLLILALLYGLSRQPAEPQTPPSSTNGQVPVEIFLTDSSMTLPRDLRF